MKVSREREEGRRQNIPEIEKAKQAHNRAWEGVSREVERKQGERGTVES